jgi:hypothetical protein
MTTSSQFSTGQGVDVMELVELRLDDGTVLLVEATADHAQGIDRVGRGTDVARQATESLQGALQKMRPALSTIVSQVRGVAEPPEAITVQFGIKVSAGAGVVVAHAATEANFTITAEWRA